jgi:hypothetical protein
MKDKILRWWRYTWIRTIVRDTISGIKNLIRWFPVIWKDRDWDQYFIYQIIKVKLEKQAKYIGGRDYHSEAKRDAEKMRLVCRLIERQQEESYSMEYMDYQDIDFKLVPTDETERWYTVEETVNGEEYDDFFKKYPRQYKRVLSGEVNRYRIQIEEKDKRTIAMEISHENQKRCKDLIFKIMSENIERWWD